MPTAKKNFGTYLAELRRARRITLRDFCLRHGFDSSEASKIERSVLPPPADELVERFAQALGLGPESPERGILAELAREGRKEFRPKVLSEDAFASRAPLVFRTERGEKVPRGQLRGLAKLLREA